MGIGQRLDEWRALGIITDAQHATLGAIVRRERFSLFVELNALLYVGVLSLAGGLAWTFRDYIDDLGDVSILSILILLTAAAFGYCASKATPYSNDEVESPSFAFDYVLYFGCLMFSSTLAFLETQFGVFHGWNTHVLIASVVFAALAYRFDNRFVLSLALSSLAGYLGLRFNLFDTIRGDLLRLFAAMYGALLVGGGWLLYRARIKPHFFDVFLQLGVNAILLATVSGVLEPGSGVWYLLALLLLSGASIVLGVRHRRFAFVAYGTLYGYAGLSVKLLERLRSPTVGLAYVVVTGSLVVLALVVVARRFGRDE